MALRLADGTAWRETLARAVAATPEAFGPEADGVTTLRNLVEGDGGRGACRTPCAPRSTTRFWSTCPGSTPTPPTPRSPRRHAHRDWARTPLAERQARVTAALDALTDHRDLLALLLVWEIGKPWRLACADVDRASTACAGTPRRSTDARRAGSRCPGRSATSPAGTTR